MTDHRPISTRPLITRSFPDRASAERAYAAMEARGYKSGDIHVLMSDDSRKKLFGHEGETTNLGNKVLAGAGVGGVIGGAAGATLVGIMAAAAALTIPGLGLVIAGPLAGALAGGAAGAATGGLVGMLVGAGIPEDRAREYETELRNGSIVLGVTPLHDADARYFESEWMEMPIRQ